MSIYIHVRHSVEDFERWKAVYDAQEPNRMAAGSTGTNYVMRNVDDPGEVVVYIAFRDLEQARTYTQSPKLKEAMQQAGVTGPPDILFLELVD